MKRAAGETLEQFIDRMYACTIAEILGMCETARRELPPYTPPPRTERPLPLTTARVLTRVPNLLLVKVEAGGVSATVWMPEEQ